MKRTFIALKVVPGQKMMECIGFIRKELHGEKIKWVDPGKLHITLRFLGDSDPDRVNATIRMLETLVPGYREPVVAFKGLGLFRNIRDPRVLWIGMDPGDILPRLKDEIEREVSNIGFPPEDRKFRPHLTLARIKYLRSRDILQDAIKRYADSSFQTDQIGEIIYYESMLKPEGPTYIPLNKVRFKNP